MSRIKEVIIGLSTTTIVFIILGWIIDEPLPNSHPIILGTYIFVLYQALSDSEKEKEDN